MEWLNKKENNKMRICPDCRGRMVIKEVVDFNMGSVDLVGVGGDGKLHAEVLGSGECKEKPCPRCNGRGRLRPLRMGFLFAWYDLWVGFYYNRAMKRLYFFPLPMLGCYIERG